MPASNAGARAGLGPGAADAARVGQPRAQRDRGDVEVGVAEPALVHAYVRTSVPSQATRPTKTTTRQQDAEQARRALDGGPGLGRQQVGLQQDLAGGRQARARDEHVARAGGEHVGDVEAGASGASIDGTPSSSRRPWMSSASAWLRPPATRDELALGELRLDLARALVGLGHRLVDAACARRRRAACRTPGRSARRASASGAARADERLSHGPPRRRRRPPRTAPSVDAGRSAPSARRRGEADDEPLDAGPAARRS